MEEQKVHEVTDLEVFAPIKTALAKLKDEYGNRVYVVTNPADMAVAKKARADVKKWRTGLEKARKAAKAGYLESGRRVDAGAKVLAAEFWAIEQPIHDLIKAEEDRKAELKRIADEKEAARVKEILDQVAFITATPARNYRSSAADLKIVIEEFKGHHAKVDDGFFAEYTEQVKNVLEHATEDLQDLLVQAEAAEAEAGRLVAERASLEAEQERVRKDNEAIAAAREEEAAEERKLLQAERDKVAEESRLLKEEKDRMEREKNDAFALKAAEEQLATDLAEGEAEKLAESQEKVGEAIEKMNKDEPEWEPKVRRLKKDVLNDILELCPPSDNDVLWPEKRLERIEAICIANLK